MMYQPVFGTGKSQVNGWQFMQVTKMRLMSGVEFSAGSTRWKFERWVLISEADTEAKLPSESTGLGNKNTA